MDIVFGRGIPRQKYWVEKCPFWSVGTVASSLLVLGDGETGNNSDCDNIRGPLARRKKNKGKVTLVDPRLYDSNP
jgi:hypothetical protein